ncbi:MAG TPA: DNA polymerase III subunit gamma/tau [Rectinemataceae bacterium]|nr:DNA polymerase III subunit gamma/tau [Rectinemataceae bacterium]
MPYEITATRKRPQGFEELAGQDFVSATLEASLASGRIAHAYLFSGPRGCGKTSTARILAKALNCEKGPTATPCGTCSNCRSIAAGSSLDVIEIDGASNTSVEGVRQIKDEVLFPPNSARYKVYIIDEVHMLSMSAFNALLKTIEEPPPYVIFIFATTELHKVPATIKSRCQQFAFRLIPIDTIRERLASAAADLSVSAEDAALLWIAKESGGSLRDAYTLFDQVVAFSEGGITVAGIREKLGLIGLEAMNGLFEAVVDEQSGGTARALEALDALLSSGVSPEQFAIDAIDYLRALLLIGNGMGRESLIGAPATSYSSLVLAALDSERIERGLGLFLELHRNLRASPNPRFELELAVARLGRLKDFVSPSSLARAVAALRAGALPAAPSLQKPSRLGASPESPAAVTTPQAEKKKPDLIEGLPPSLSNAFSSLAGAVLGEKAAAGFKAQASIPTAPVQPTVERTARVEVEPVIASHRDPEASDSPAPPSSAPEERPSDPEPSFVARIDPDLAAFRRDLIAKVGRSNPLLGSGLAASLGWNLEGDRLVISFRNAMEEGVVRAELGILANTVKESMGRELTVELKVSDGAESKRRQASSVHDHSDPVAIVERMFRGQRLEQRQRGGQDELR